MNHDKEICLLENSALNVISQNKKKGDFCTLLLKNIFEMHRKTTKSKLVKLWSTMKEDEQKHLKKYC
jgi:hypothetical protein